MMRQRPLIRVDARAGGFGREVGYVVKDPCYRESLRRLTERKRSAQRTPLPPTARGIHPKISVAVVISPPLAFSIIIVVI